MACVVGCLRRGRALAPVLTWNFLISSQFQDGKSQLTSDGRLRATEAPEGTSDSARKVPSRLRCTPKVVVQAGVGGQTQQSGVTVGPATADGPLSAACSIRCEVVARQQTP